MSQDMRLTPAQRAAAIERAGENLALLSGAGCGKTLVLARRFTELLLAGGGLENPLSRFVALTFTDKAAMEMLGRVRRLLHDRAAVSRGDDRRKLLDWLQELPEARISTIHSFCASLLRTHAIEAGIDPNFAVCADPLVASQMLSEAAEQVALRAVEAGGEDVAEAISLVSHEALVEQVRRLVELRTAWDPSAYDDPQRTLGRWRTLAAAQKQAAWEALASDSRFLRQLESAEGIYCSDPTDKLSSYRQEQFEIVRELLSDVKNWTGDLFARLRPKPGNIGSGRHWGGKEQLKKARRQITAVVARLAELSIRCEEFGPPDEQAARLLAVLTGLARDAEAAYAQAKRRRGLLDFTDLLAATHRLLVENEPLRKGIAGGMNQLLVDEAQDTDAFQIELLELCAFGEAGLSSPPDGRLFLVGDAKQSIYRFRGAQVEVFRKLCERLGPGHREDLSHSFRTHEAGVAFINHLFAPLLGEDYAPIISHRPEHPPGQSVEILLAAGGKYMPIDGAEGASAAQAALTAQRIGEMVAGQERLVWDRQSGEWRAVEYGDIAVLFARMTKSLEYERQLALRNIPYHVIGGTGFFKQQEVYDVLNALRVIDNPFDDVAFIGALRSSLFGLDDNALMRIAQALEPPYFPKLSRACREASSRGRSAKRSRTVPGLSDEQSEALRFAVELLDSLHRDKDAIGIDAVIEHLLDATGYEAVLLSQFQGRRLAGNVARVLDLARSAAAEGLVLADFIAQMGEHVLSESRYEQAAEAGEAENVVRLMTIHKAKGLEFPVVFVPDLNRATRGPDHVLLNRIDWGLTYKLKPAQEDQGDDEAPLSYRLARLCEQADQEKEDIRRLYVAATRHEDYLVFVAADWRTKNGEFRRGASYLRRLDDVLGISRAIEAGAGAIPYGDGRFSAIVRKVKLTPPRRRRAKPPPGESLLAGAACGSELGEAVLKAAPAEAPQMPVGPVSAALGNVELPVTALSDFQYCPMLYRWRHELRIPRWPAGSAAPEKRRQDAHRLDAATLGTLYHRCMELLDFAHPPSARSLVRRAAGEMALEEAPDIDAAVEEFGGMLEKFSAHPLAGSLGAARQIFRELDFVTEIDGAALRGQIDLLYQDAQGTWRIVDYKSDRLEGEDIEAHARRYELQMLAYAGAATRHLSGPIAGATVYFLRPAAACDMRLDAAAIAAAHRRIAELIRRLLIARRTGSFEARTSDGCRICQYRPLCRKAH